MEPWRQGPKTIVDGVVTNGFPMVALWGREFVQPYSGVLENPRFTERRAGG